MLQIVGTVPDEQFPLTRGPAILEGDCIVVQDHRIPVNRGTPALIGAAAMAADVLGLEPVHACLAGDIGLGTGSRKLYDHLVKTLPGMSCDILVFHYLQPDVDWHNRILFALDEMEKPPRLIADAGFMYAAKMSGQAGRYDLFTPDVGELSFLADETAPHPFYTRGFILHQDNQVPDLIARACEYENAARHLLVKGRCDYVVARGQIIDEIREPSSPEMEAVGGTGDTLTGLACSLLHAGKSMSDACRTAAEANRVAGCHANPSPATQVMEIIRQIPRALADTLNR